MLNPLLQLMETAINYLIEQDHATYSALKNIDQKAFAVEITDLETTIYMQVQEHSICLYTHFTEKVDTTIKGKFLGLIGTALNQAHTDALFEHSVTIEGNLKAGEQMRNILSKLNIDYEHLLAQHCGNTLSIQSINGFKKTKQFLQDTKTSIKQQLRDYLHIEQGIGIDAEKIQQFKHDVHSTRMATERLEAQIHHYIQTRK
jgi:ubiquinone biosynthesis protein UbiJ